MSDMGEIPVTDRERTVTPIAEGIRTAPLRQVSQRSEPALSRVAPTERTALEDSMGLSVTQLLALTDGTLVAGSAGAGRVVRQVVVDDPADPLAGAGPDVLVVLGARLPPADPGQCRALIERLTALGTAALAYRDSDGPPAVPAEVRYEADRRGFPIVGWTWSWPRCSARSCPSRPRR
jgi:purine catabolism regulator